MAILSLKPKEKDKKDIEFKRLDPDILAQRDYGIAQQKLQERIAAIPDRPIQTFLLNAIDSALLSPKVTDVLTLGALKQTREDMALKNPKSALLGNIAGYIVPGTFATKGAGLALKGATKLGLRAGVRGAKTVGKATKTISRAMQSSKALNYAVTEGIAGTGIGLGQGIIEGESSSDIAKRVALEAGIGATGGALFGKLASRKPKKVNDAQLIESVKNNYFKGAKLQQIEQPKGKLRQFKELRQAKIDEPKPFNINDELDSTKSLFDEQVQAVTERFEQKISQVKSEMPKGNARKRQINKFNKQKQREILKIEKNRTQTITELEKQLPKVEPEITKPTPQADTRTPEQIELDTKISKIKSDFEAKRESVKRQFSSDDVKAKQIKALGFEESAEIRKTIQGDKLIPVEGGLTAKELKTKVDKLKTNYIGKDVLVDGKQGKIEKNVFGDVMVKLDDGTTVKVPKDQVKPLQDVDAIIKEQMKQPKPKPVVKTVEKPTVAKPTPKPTPKPKKVDEVTKVKPMPKTMKVKGLKFEPKASENSSASSIVKQVDDKPNYKGEERESRFRQKTMYEADVTGKDIKKSIEDNKTTYRSVDNQKDWEFAKSKVDRDFDGELKKFRDTGKRTGSVDTMRGEALFVNALQKGDTKLADEISSELSLRLTEAGQEIQAASFFKKLSPEGMIMYQQKLINKVNAGIEETAEEAFKKIKPKRGVAQGVFKVSDLVDDASWLKGFLEDMNKQCKL